MLELRGRRLEKLERHFPRAVDCLIPCAPKAFVFVGTHLNLKARSDRRDDGSFAQTAEKRAAGTGERKRRGEAHGDGRSGRRVCEPKRK
jgi:hypothetical protein